MKKLLLSCAVVESSMSVFADDVILFQDDFEWLGTETNISTYVSSGKNVSDNVGNLMYSAAYNPQSKTIKSNDGTKTVWDLLLDRGYGMYSTDEEQAKKAVGLAQNYIKMSVTTYTAKLELPALTAAGDGMNNVRLSFDWTPMTDGGKAVWDQTVICVEVKNGDEIKVFPIEPIQKVDGFIDDDKEKGAITPYQWHNVDIALDGITINKDTRISLRNADPDFPETSVTGAKKRWFLDNIKVYASAASVGEIVSDMDAPVEYYNLQGVKVANPENGIFICRQGSKTTKVTLK